jgi:CubicO group peptidase (beta-lactamase class C family)
MGKPHLQKMILESMKKHRIPGLAIGIIENGRLDFSHGYGLRDKEQNQLVDSNTIFEAASLSKPVFSYAVLKLIESKDLNLDTPLSQYLPNYISNDPRIEKITTRHILSHTSGFPNRANRTLKDGPLRIHFSPGSRFSYSGEGFVYLQKVIEKITQQPLQEFMNQSVFRPLKLDSSSFTWSDRFQARLSQGFDSDGAPSPREKYLHANAAYTLYTSISDYSKFIAAILNDSCFDNDPFQEMLRSQINVNPNCLIYLDPENSNSFESKVLSWSLGWGIESKKDHVVFWHWGDNGAFKNFVLFNMSTRSAVIIFTNSWDGMSAFPDILKGITGCTYLAFDWLERSYAIKDSLQ